MTSKITKQVQVLDKHGLFLFELTFTEAGWGTIDTGDEITNGTCYQLDRDMMLKMVDHREGVDR